MRLDQDPKTPQPFFYCEWCNDVHNGDCEDDE